MKNSIKTLKAFNMVEIMIVVCLLVTTVILCIPTIFNNSKEAKIISGWKRIYAEMQSNFEVFNVSDADVIEKICRSNVAQKEPEIFKVISPYLNVDLSRNPNTLKYSTTNLKTVLKFQCSQWFLQGSFLIRKTAI